MKSKYKNFLLILFVILSVFGIILILYFSSRNTVPKQADAAVIDVSCKKLGINYAQVAPTPNTYADRALGYGMGYSLEIVANRDQVWDVGYKSFAYALDHGITPILRVCYGNTCDFKDPQVYINFINTLADILGLGQCQDPTSALCKSRTFYVIAGPNEALQDTWLGGTENDYQTIAPLVADYMNKVINGVSKPNVKFLSPAFNSTEANFENFVSALKASGAQFQKLSGIAANAYNINCYNVGNRIQDYVQRIRNAGFSSFDIYLTEIGVFECPTISRSLAITQLAREISLLKYDTQVKAGLLFNSFGNNTTPGFSYNVFSDQEFATLIPADCQVNGVFCGPVDINGDNQLDITDFGEFAKAYKKNCNDIPPVFGCKGKDSNMDGMVNLIDLSSFASRYKAPSCL